MCGRIECQFLKFQWYIVHTYVIDIIRINYRALYNHILRSNVL